MEKLMLETFFKYSPVLIACISAIISFIIAFRDLKKPKNRKKINKYKLSYHLLFLTLFLSLIAAIVQFAQTKISETEARNKEIIAESLRKTSELKQDTISMLQKELNSKSQKIISLNEKLYDKTLGLLNVSEEARNIQKETINYMIGSNDISIKFESKSKGIFTPIITNNSKYPLVDALVTVENLDDILKNCHLIEFPNGKRTINSDCYYSNIQSSKIDFVEPFSSMRLNNFIYKKNEQQNITMKFNFKNKSLIYYCVIKTDDFFCKTSVRAYTIDIKSAKAVFYKQLINELNLNEKYWKENFIDKDFYLTSRTKAPDSVD